MLKLLAPIALCVLCIVTVRAAEMSARLTRAKSGVPLVYLSGATTDFSRATGDCGIASPQALLAIFHASGVHIRVALDRSRNGLALPDRVRFTFDGGYAFRLQETLPLLDTETKAGGRTVFSYGGPFEVTRDGQRMTLNVSGEVIFLSPTKTSLTFNVFATATRPCVFGTQTYDVTIIDGNANLQLGDVPATVPPQSAPADAVGFTPGDLLYIGKVTGARGACGQPIRVNDRWFRMTLAPDAGSLRAEPLERAAGLVQVELPCWNGVFIGPDGIVQLFGDRQPVNLPPGAYTLAQCDFPPASGSRPWQAPLYRNCDRKVSVVPETPASIPVYAEARCKLVIAPGKAREATATLTYTDGLGAAIDPPENQGGATLAFEVVNAQGQPVAKGQFQVVEQKTATYAKEYG